MAESKRYDLIVIGSGPGGYVAAIRASQLGLRTAIVEGADLGGVCLNWGCIPTKALLRSAEVLHLAQTSASFGVRTDAAAPDLPAMVARSRAIAGQLSSGVAFLMKKHKIDILRGWARLEAGDPAPKVVIERGPAEGVHQPRFVLLATGARARELPAAGLKADGRAIWTYREAMTPDELPARLLVIGSGAIGVEFASFYRTLGSEVTVVESMDRILPAEDAEISTFMAKQFARQGMKILTSATVESLTVSPAGVRASIRTGETRAPVEADRVILAIGIVGNVEGLGLEALGVRIERSHVLVDARGATGVKGLYAIGDLTGGPWLAHKAMHEGVAAVEAMAGAPEAHPFETWNIPGCTYSHPQVASVGLTEEAARAKGRKIRVGRFPYLGNGKAIALGETEGLIKTIFDETTGELLGAHLAGEGVTELIQGFAIARQGELTEAELMATVFPHPTLSEMMHESVLAAYGRPLHI